VTFAPPNSHGVTAALISSDPAAVGTVLTADNEGGAAFEAAGGGPSALFDSTLGSNQAAIDTGAGGIAQTADHLLVVMLLRTTEGVVPGAALLTFNADVGANYDRQTARIVNTSLSGTIALAGTSVLIGALGASAQAGAFSAITLQIPCYRQTTAHKSFHWQTELVEDTATVTRTEFGGGRWRSTAAITRLAITGSNGNLVAGSRVSVYGY
jgi:hypothetical protein